MNDPAVAEALYEAFYQEWHLDDPAGYDRLKSILAEAAPPRADQKEFPSGMANLIASSNTDPEPRTIFRELLKSPNKAAIEAWLRLTLTRPQPFVTEGGLYIWLEAPESFDLFYDDAMVLSKSADLDMRRDVFAIFAEYEVANARLKATVDRALLDEPLEVSISAASKRFSGGDRSPTIVKLVTAGLRSERPEVFTWGYLAIMKAPDRIISVAEVFENLERKDVSFSENCLLSHLRVRRAPEATRMGLERIASDRYEWRQQAACAVSATGLRPDRAAIDLLLKRFNNRGVYRRIRGRAEYANYQVELQHAPNAIQWALLDIAGPGDSDLAPLFRRFFAGHGPENQQRMIESLERIEANDPETLAFLLDLSERNPDPTTRECARSARAVLASIRN